MSRLVAVEPGIFSDELLLQIVEAMALCGESPIAQLVQRIRLERNQEQIEIESSATREIDKAGDESRCWDLYFALKERHAIDNSGRLDVRKLCGCLRRTDCT